MWGKKIGELYKLYILSLKRNTLQEELFPQEFVI